MNATWILAGLAGLAALGIGAFSMAQHPATQIGPASTQNDPSREMYSTLRAQALATRADDLDLTAEYSGKVYGVVMEIDIEGETATLVAFATGDASLYLSTGGGMIGGIAHKSVRDAAQAFVLAANSSPNGFSPASSLSRPGPGETRFYLLTAEGAFAASAPEQALGEESHSLSPLFFAGQDVISQLRQAPPR